VIWVYSYKQKKEKIKERKKHGIESSEKWSSDVERGSMKAKEKSLLHFGVGG